ncbi:MAG: ATP-dependent DNA helicase [Candidatus Paceibacterota bacterium]|jgi:DNA helicase-2/ATP-dependent DNA helicase PcrA
MHNNKDTSEFALLYKVLNTPQKQAVDAIEGPVMVIAGPGTGKTTILTLRIANILRETDTVPESILALTFTESGAFAMRRKLLSIIGPTAYKVNIQTFHGFAEKIIQKFPDYFSRIIGSSPIQDTEQYKIIENIIHSKKIKVLRPYGDQTYYVRSILQEIHILKRENISPEMLRQSVIKETLDNQEGSGKEESRSKIVEREKLQKQKEKNLELAFVYKSYETELAKKKYYDFDDMLLELIRAMEDDPMFKLILQEQYQYILADEHQDANASQNRILELLADFHSSPNLFIVGDEKQAIYRFQGASLENFLYFSKKYPDAIVIDLEHNYRSHQGILDAGASIIENNPGIPDRKRTRLKSLQVGTKPIYISEFATRNDELQYLTVMIERLLKKGEKPKEIAVLYRENKEAEDISRILKSHNIINRVESDHNILLDIDSAKLILISRAVADLSNSNLLGSVLLLREFDCDPAQIASLCALSNRERRPLFEVIKESRYKEAITAYNRLVEWSERASVTLFIPWLHSIIEETRMIVSIAESPDSLSRYSSLELFLETLTKVSRSDESFYLKNFIEYIDIVSDHGVLVKQNNTDHVDGVRLMTAHRAKGLEFNHVFIVNAIDGNWGNRSKRNHFSIPIIEHARDTGRIEDERRLFYVAITRARESVNISYARSRGDKEVMPCQFISEIDPGLISFEKPMMASQLPHITPHAKSKDQGLKHSILNPDFVRSKFLGEQLSVTHLNNYLKCAWQYFFVNLIRIPQAQTKHQMYGTAVHNALKAYFDAYRDERDMSLAKLIKLFKNQIDSQPMSKDDRIESFKKGERAIKGYIKTYQDSWNRNILTEYSIKRIHFDIGTKENESLMLTGKLDKVEFLDDRNVAIVDYKTAKPKSRNEIEGKTLSADGNYKRQLAFYKLLTDGDDKFVMKYGEIDFIEPNERGIYKKERFEISAEDTDRLKTDIKKMFHDITELTFVESGCGEKDCEYCKLGKILIS